MKIDSILKKYTAHLMSIPGVVGTGQGIFDGQPCINVFVIRRTTELEEKIEKTLEGYRVGIIETGAVFAQAKK